MKLGQCCLKCPAALLCAAGVCTVNVDFDEDGQTTGAVVWLLFGDRTSSWKYAFRLDRELSIECQYLKK